MTPKEIDIFIEERKWDYRGIIYSFISVGSSLLTRFIAFGFVASLLERLPFVGLLFSITNQVGAAMWAHGMSLLFSAPYCQSHQGP